MISIDDALNQMTACGVPNPGRSRMDPFENIYRDRSNDPITLKDDALALSCCAWRLRTTGGPDYWTFQSEDVLKAIIHDDHVHAQEIRNYYGKKILWLQLNNNRVSPFRTDLMSYIHQADPKIVTDKISGMIHKMPDFFQEDKILDRIKQLADTTPIQDSPPLNTPVVLSPVEIVLRRSKLSKVNNYWMLTGDKRLCQIEIPQPNPLEPLWLDLYNNSATITISGKFIPTCREDFNFYRVTNWKVEK